MLTSTDQKILDFLNAWQDNDVQFGTRTEFEKLDALYPNLTDAQATRWGQLADRLDREARRKEMRHN